MAVNKELKKTLDEIYSYSDQLLKMIEKYV